MEPEQELVEDEPETPVEAVEVSPERVKWFVNTELGIPHPMEIIIEVGGDE